AIAWVRPEGRSLIHWALAAIEFKFGQASDSKSSYGAEADEPTYALGHSPDRSINDRGSHLSVVAAHTESIRNDRMPATTATMLVDDDVIELPEANSSMAPH